MFTPLLFRLKDWPLSRQRAEAWAEMARLRIDERGACEAHIALYYEWKVQHG